MSLPLLAIALFFLPTTVHASLEGDRAENDARSKTYASLEDVIADQSSPSDRTRRGTKELLSGTCVLQPESAPGTRIELKQLRVQYRNNSPVGGQAEAVVETSLNGQQVHIRFHHLELTVGENGFGLLSETGTRGPPSVQKLDLPDYDVRLSHVDLDFSRHENPEHFSGKPASFRGLIIRSGRIQKRLGINPTNRVPELTFPISNRGISFQRGKLSGTFSLRSPARFCLTRPAGGHLYVVDSELTVGGSGEDHMYIDGGLSMPEDLKPSLCLDHLNDHLTRSRARELFDGSVAGDTSTPRRLSVANPGQRGTLAVQNGSGGSDLQDRLIRFTGAQVDNEGNFYVENLDMGRTPFLDGNFALQASSVTLDFSNQQSPSGNIHGLTLEDSDQGVYIAQGALYLNFLDERSIEVSEFFVGDEGLFGTVSMSGTREDPVFPEIELGGFSFLFTEIGVTFEHTAIVDSTVGSWITIPIGDGKVIKTEVKFGENGLQSVSISGEGNTTWSLLNGGVVIEIQQATFGDPTGSTWYLTIDGSLTANVRKLSMEGAGISFNGLTMDGEGNFETKEMWVNTGDGATIGFDSAQMAIQQIGFGQNDSGSQIWVGFSASVNLGDDFGVNSSGVKVWFQKQPFSFSRFEVDSFGINFNKFGVKFSGTVEFTDTGFRAELQIVIKSINLEIEGVFIAGKEENFRYWRVYIEVTVPGSGIPLSPIPASIYGVGGGFASNMEVQVSDNGQNTEFSPSQGVFSFQLSVSMGSPDNHTTWFAKGTLTIQPQPLVINLPVQCWLFQSGTPSGSAPINASLNITEDSFLLRGTASPPIKVGSFTSEPEVELYFNTSQDWHVHIGTEANPVPVNIAGIPAQGYLQVNSSGQITLGCSVGGSFQKEFKFIKQFRIRVSLEAGVTVSLDIQKGYFMANIFVDIGVKFDMYRTPAFGNNHWDNLMTLGVGIDATVEVFGQQNRWEADYEAYVEVSVVGIGVDTTVSGTASGTF